MRIGVFIPVVQECYVKPLVTYIENNTVRPDKIIILDNSANSNIVVSSKRSCLEIIKPPEPLTVNRSWNYGISKLAGEVDLVSILNDDLIIEDMFFEKLLYAARKNAKAGVFCPNTAHDQNKVKNVFKTTTCSRMTKREGWAWTIRSEVAKLIDPIPEKLVTWCGDDWYWHHCHKLNRPWMKMSHNNIFHFVGASHLLLTPNRDRKGEIKEAREILESLI